MLRFAELSKQEPTVHSYGVCNKHKSFGKSMREFQNEPKRSSLLELICNGKSQTLN